MSPVAQWGGKWTEYWCSGDWCPGALLKKEEMMGKKAKITAGEIVMEMEFNDSETALAVWDVLPIKARGNTWGDEIYFSIPVVCELENPKEVVALGDIGYWPSGNAFCIFFGKTPASRGDEIRPASAVNIIGKLLGNPKEFKKVKSGSEIIIERL